MGKIIDFKKAKRKIESKKKKQFKSTPVKKIYGYKTLIVMFIIILSITSLFFLSTPFSTPHGIDSIKNEVGMQNSKSIDSQ